jgi:autotransporter-associated beta strand protein
VLNSGMVIFGTNTAAAGSNSSLGTGSLVLNGGTAKFSGSVSGSNGFYNPISVQSASTISGGGQLGGVITGTGQLTFGLGSGNMIFFGPSNQFTGYTGLLEMGTATGLLGFTNSNGGTGVGLDLGTASASFAYTSGNATVNFASLAGGASTILGGDRKIGASNNVTFSIGYGGQSTVFAGTIKDTSNSTTSTATVALTLVGGTLALTGTNTYKGQTTISAGTLMIGNGTSTGTFGTGAVVNNSVLVLNRTDTAYTPSNAMSGTGSLINNGTGVVTLTGNNSYSGGTTVNFGVLQTDNATSGMGTATVTVNSGGAIGGTGVIGAPVSVQTGGIIAPGDAGVSHGQGFGVGTLTAQSVTAASGGIFNYEFGSAANDLLNITTANGLSVTNDGINLYQANSVNAFDTNGVYNIFQFPSPFTGTVSPSGFLNVLNAVGGVTYTWGTSGNDITLTISGGATSTSWNNTAGGSWAVSSNWTGGVPNGIGASATLGTILAAPGTVSLGGSETVGSLVFNNTSGGAGNSYIVAQTNLTDTLVIDNGGPTGLGSITVSNGNQMIAAPVGLNSNLSLAVSNASNTLTVSGPISGGGTITDASAGVVVFSGNNSYSGGTMLLSGTLDVGAGGTSGSLGTGNVTDGGALVFNLSGPTTIANVITGGGSLTQAGTGTLTLTSSNGYTGTTNINAGTLQYGTGVPGALNTGKVAFGGTGGTLDINGNSVSLASITGSVGSIDNVSAGGTATVTISNGSTNTFGGTINNTTGTVALVKSSGGILALTGSNAYSGGTTISAGAIKVSGSSALGTGPVTVVSGSGLQLANGAVVSNQIFTDVGGTAELEDVPDAGAIATISGPINILSGATGQQLRLATTHTNTLGVPDSTLQLTGATNFGSQVIFTRGNFIYANSGTMTTGSSLIVGRGSSGSVANLTIESNASITSNGASLNGNNSTSDALQTSVTIQDNGVFNVGTGTMNIDDSRVNTSSPQVNLTMSGNAELAAGGFTILSSSIGPVTLTVLGGTLKANANDPAGGQWFPQLANNGGGSPITANIGTGVNLDNGGFGITVGEQFGDAGSGSFNFIGSGTTSIKSLNAYSGNDTVTGGTLVIADNSGFALGFGSQVTLNAGSTLASDPAVPDANITQNVVPGTGTQTIAPGKAGSIGTFTLNGGLTTANTTTLNFDLGTGAGPIITTGDILTFGSGTFTIGSGTMLSFGGTPIGGDDYRLITGSIGGINLANFSLPSIPGLGLSLSTSVDPGSIDLVVVQTGPASLTWNNAGADNLWNTTSSNWNSGASNTTYSNGALVTFNDNNPSNTAGNYNVTLNTTVSPGSVTVNNSNGNYVIGGTGSIAGTTALSKSGSSKLTLNTVNTYTGGTTVSAGTLVAGVTGALPSGAVSITGGTLQLATSTGLATLTSLAISGTGTFDINNNHVIINYGAGPDPITSIMALLNAGFNGGAWNGLGGIDSSAVASNSGYSVGYADSADPGNPAGLASGTLEIAFTLLGDSNLDKAVNGVDFGILAANFNKGVTGWDKGDFNYDNAVNGVDFGALAANFNKGASAASAADWVALEQFAAANGLLADVPEPASIGLLAAGACGLMARRRRSAK